MEAPNLDELNHRVTCAILVAEGLPAGSPEARRAFRQVSLLEEHIARLTRPSELRGEIARLGAVSASLSAGDPLRAEHLARAYLTAGGLAADIVSKLKAMLSEGLAERYEAGED